MKVITTTLILTLISLIFSTVASGQFKKGYVYNHRGEKLEGLLKYNVGGGNGDRPEGYNSVYYKKDKGTKKRDWRKLTTNTIRSFVIEKDSFVTVYDFSINKRISYQQDFAKVLKAGRITLYLYESKVTDYGVNGSTQKISIKLIEKDGVVDRLKSKNFKELMRQYVYDCPDLMQKVETGKLQYFQIETIVQVYNEYCQHDDN